MPKIDSQKSNADNEAIRIGLSIFGFAFPLFSHPFSTLLEKTAKKKKKRIEQQKLYATFIILLYFTVVVKEFRSM